MKTKLQKLSIAVMVLVSMLCSGSQTFGQLTSACSPSYSSGSYSWNISSVIIGTFNHNPSYNIHDYTAQSFSLEAGTTTSISVVSNGWCAVGAAADFNNDGDFDDVGEILALPAYIATAPATYIFDLAIPATVAAGDYRFRLWNIGANSGAGNPVGSPCGAYNYGSWLDYTINVTIMIPPDNAGIDSLVSPAASGIFCSGQQDVAVRLRNLGSNTLQNVQINWSIDGILQTPATFSTALDSVPSPNDWAIVTLGAADFPYNTPVEIKSWTSMPNSVTDNDNSDDTLSQMVTSTKQGIILSIRPQDTTICSGGSVTLDAGSFPANPIYIWQPSGAMTRTINVVSAGDYSVKVLNSTGCQAVDTVHINVNPSPTVSAVSAIDLGNGDFNFSVVGAMYVDKYIWNFGDGSLADTMAPPASHHYSAIGVYAVTLTLINDCGGVNISKQVNVETTGITTTNSLQSKVILYPNPAQNQITLFVNGDITLHQIEVYNLLGQKVVVEKVNGKKVILNTTSFASGLYNVILNTDKGRFSKKFTIKK